MSIKPTNHATVSLQADSLTDGLVCDHGDGSVSIRVCDGGAFGVSVWIGGDAVAWTQFTRDVGRIMGLAAEAMAPSKEGP